MIVNQCSYSPDRRLVTYIWYAECDMCYIPLSFEGSFEDAYDMTHEEQWVWITHSQGQHLFCPECADMVPGEEIKPKHHE